MIKKIIPLALAALVAAASYFVADTPVGDAIQIALDTDKAKAACSELLNH